MVANIWASFVQIAYIQPQQPESLGGGQRIWALGGIGRHRLLADLVLTTRLGLHLAYTWYKLGLHVATMSNDY